MSASGAPLRLTPTTRLDGLDAYQLVTVASIAQKEGYYARYMGEVARVVLNRLARRALDRYELMRAAQERQQP
ncbi:MAG: endolytic transglycosylase MltG, partial [Gammaproteobacteria bacterium]|nr:endolytic transglycosylase MltG [Gammaproteobacteria bacterium]